MDVSKATLERFPLYYRVLRRAHRDGVPYLSSEEMGRELGIRGTQIRKDLTCFKEKGVPSVGYSVIRLKAQLEEFLGIHTPKEALIIGVGDLGKALTKFGGFQHLNIRISEAFDCDPEVIGTTVGSTVVRNIDQLSKVVNSEDITIAILAVPGTVAQELADKLVEVGILSIWNFSPRTLVVPPEVFVRNEDLSTGLAVVAHHAKQGE